MGGLWICLWQRRWRLYGLAGIAAGVLAMALVRPPDLLVSEDGKLVAVKDDSGEMLFSSGRAARFDGGIWLRRAGQKDRAPWPRDGYGADGRLACDALGCIYRAEGQIISIAWKPGALIEDCHVADLVVSTEPVRRACPSAKRVIDRFDLWRDGGHAVWIERDGVRIQSVREARGARPWVVDPRSDL
jgi:competence protein ComEC